MLRRIGAVIGKELASAAASPSAWVFLVIFLVLSSFCAFVAGGMFSTGQADLTPFFDWMPWLFLLIVPALAMPMWSEERRLGVFELTMSLPARLWEMALGKFLAGTILLAIALGLTAPVPLTAVILGEPDPGAILCGYAGALMLGCAYLAVSSFCSAVSKSQTASFLLSVLLCGAFLFAGWQKVTDLLSLWLPGKVVRALASCAFLTNYQAFQKGVLDTSELIYTVMFSGFFVCLSWFTLEYVSSASGGLFAPGALRDGAYRRAAGRFLGRTLYVLALAVACVVAGSVWKMRIDASGDRAYSIADQTKRLAASVDGPVELRLYASVSNPAMPPVLRKYAERVEWLLREFAEASHGKIRLRVMDPAEDSVEEESALLDGCRPVTDASGARFLLGVSASHGGSTSTVPFLSPVQENQLEYEIARTTRNAVRPFRPKLGVLSSLPVFGSTPDLSDFGQRPMETVKADPPWYAISELSRDFDLVRIPEDASEIPADLSALLVIHPSRPLPRTLFALDQFVLRGGRLAVFLDPRSFYAAVKGRSEYALLDRLESDLGPLPSAWGAVWNSSVLAADLVSAYRKRLPDRMVTNPLVLNLQPEQISRENPLTEKLNAVSLYFTGFFQCAPPEGVKAEILLKTSKESQAVSSLLGDRPELVLRNFRASGMELPLAVALKGTFRTAFPGGSPDPGSTEGKPSLKTGISPAEIYLFADSDMLFNDVCITQANDLFGQKSYVRSNDNVTLLQNVAERLAGLPPLAAVRSRIPMSRPLTRVNELKAEAELRYRNRLLVIEREFLESGKRIEALERLEKSNPAAASSSELKAEKRAIAAKNASSRRELNELRGNLKADLNRLETRIKIINLALVPGLVALIGVLWAFLRHTRMIRRKPE